MSGPVRQLLALASASLCLASMSVSSLAHAVQQTGETVDIQKARQAFLEDAIAPTTKPKGYDVTIVEYMDYQCPSCRASLGPLKQLLAQDKKVRVIYRDWPIFGPASERAAGLAIASQWQGKHSAFHEALMTTPRPFTELKFKAAAKKAGVNWLRLESDLKSHLSDVTALLDRNNKQAESLGLEGTPGFIIGNVQSFGGMDLAAFRKAVKRARAEAADPKKFVPQLPTGI